MTFRVCQERYQTLDALNQAGGTRFGLRPPLAGISLVAAAHGNLSEPEPLLDFFAYLEMTVRWRCAHDY